MALAIPFEGGKQARRVLPIHDVYDEDHVGHAEVALDLAPLAFRQREAEVVSRNAQVKMIGAIDRSFRLPERRK